MTARSKTAATRATKSIAAHRQAMNSRTRFSFGRTFLATLQAGGIHHDAAKLSAFLIACGKETADSIKASAKAGNLTLESLNKACTKLVKGKNFEELPKNFSLSN